MMTGEVRLSSDLSESTGEPVLYALLKQPY